VGLDLAGIDFDLWHRWGSPFGSSVHMACCLVEAFAGVASASGGGVAAAAAVVVVVGAAAAAAAADYSAIDGIVIEEKAGVAEAATPDLSRNRTTVSADAVLPSRCPLDSHAAIGAA